VKRKQTGGGTFVPQIDSSLDEKLLALLGNRAKPLDKTSIAMHFTTTQVLQQKFVIHV